MLDGCYFILSVAIIVVIGVAFLEPVAVVSYERDIWHHLSVYRELIAAPFNAANPHVATFDPSRSYSPWTMSVALVARWLNMDQFGAILLSAIGSIGLILAGVFVFARQYWRHPAAPFLLLFVIFGTWLGQVDHTGYLTVRTTLFSIAYPYGSVLGMGFFAWWIALRAVKSAEHIWTLALGLAALTYAMFISHQLQALFEIGMAGAFLLFAPGKANWKQRLILCASILAGLIATRWWWYFDPIAYVLDPNVRAGHDAVRFLNYSLAHVEGVFWTLGLASFGILGFVDWEQRRIKWELLAPFIVVLSGFLILLARDNWVNVRVLPFLALILQIGLTGLILEKWQNRFWTFFQRLLTIAVCLCLIWGSLVAGSAYNRARDFLDSGEMHARPKTWNSEILAAARYAETLVPKGAIAIAQLQAAFPIEATSLSVVAIPRLFAEVPDMRERQANNELFFDPETDLTTRCAILEKYDVSLIVWRDVWITPGAETKLLRLGNRTRRADLSFIPAGPQGFDACR